MDAMKGPPITDTPHIARRYESRWRQVARWRRLPAIGVAQYREYRTCRVRYTRRSAFMLALRFALGAARVRLYRSVL